MIYQKKRSPALRTAPTYFAQTNVAHTIIALLAVAVLGGCTTPVDKGPSLGVSETAYLARYLTGSFSSASQAARDPDNYRDIRLEAVEIWPGRGRGTWLYVEQASATALDAPYRQRVYRLSNPTEDVYHSDVYEIDGPMRFAGMYRDPEALSAALTSEMLTLRDGCTIAMRWDDTRAAFVGRTGATSCTSTLRGASYAMSEVVLGPDRLLTWDRGFDASGSQVWGATEGPYEFRRVGN